MNSLFSLQLAKDAKEKKTSLVPPCKDDMNKTRTDGVPWSSVVVKAPLLSFLLCSKFCSE